MIITPYKNKSIVYETLVIPVFIYGAECWRLNKDDKKKILATEMGCLRKKSRQNTGIRNEKIGKDSDKTKQHVTK